MSLQISFHGAADSVTGSRHLVQIGGQRILLDCGLFQGFKVLRERNWAPPSPELVQADAVVLSHAHLDHSGWLPALVKHGFRGPVYASAATRDLAEVLLLDSAHLQEEDARRANRYGYSRHEKALPLYTRRDAQRAIARIVPLPPGRDAACGEVRIGFTPVGHLLGACAVTLTHRGERLAFSGDVGRSNDLLMPAPQPLSDADVLLVESTYGNRVHPKDDVAALLAQIIRDTVQRGGSVLMPAFAVGRAQALMLVLQRLKAAGQIPADLPVYLDSPMAVQATSLYHKHRRLLRVGAREAEHLADGVHMVGDARQSMRLVRSRWPSVIISASGMATGGRVLHHLKAMAPIGKHHIVFAGFQVGGSRGARLVAGASEVKIHGEYVPVRAQVSQLEGFSGHADSDEMMTWLRGLRQPPRQTFVVHGEPDASDALRIRIKDELGWQVRVPQHGETVEA
jgi:metallo-beta-lactamase family protein